MSDLAIRVEQLGKRYRIGGLPDLRYALQTRLRSAIQGTVSRFRSLTRFPASDGHTKQSADDQCIWALRDISFEVKEGEKVGVIGLNGAGKSTLLKILTRITEPTEGYAETRGRVSSLLEVGTGFHEELTGRENTYLNGAILGMTKSEIDRKYDDIVAFAEVEKFMETPVKRYSTGMKVRLAFAVAAHLEPEILLVDEVLAVGDIGFQQKCLGRMEDAARGGRTVLFVSHNMGAISTLCERAILLKDGRIDFVGPTQEAISTYLANFGVGAGLRTEWTRDQAPGGEHSQLKSIAISDARGFEKPYFSVTEPILVTIEYRVTSDGVPVNAGFFLYDEHGNWICGVGNYTETRTRPVNTRGLYRSTCTIPGYLLNSGRHTITATLASNLSDQEVRAEHCAAFETVDDHRHHSLSASKWGGIIKPEFEWQSRRIGDSEEAESYGVSPSG